MSRHYGIPLPLAKNQSCLPVTQSLSDMHAPAEQKRCFSEPNFSSAPSRPSILPSLCPSSLLPPCSPAGGCFALGAELPPAPTASSLPCLHSSGLADGRKHACGEELTPLSLPFSFFLPLHPSLAGPIGGACPVPMKMTAMCLRAGLIWRIGVGCPPTLRQSAGSKQQEWGRRGRF